MRRIHGFGRAHLGIEHFAEHDAKAIAAIAHRKEFNGVAMAGAAPTTSNRVRGLVRGECPLEFVRHDQNPQSHARNYRQGTAYLQQVRVNGFAP